MQQSRKSRADKAGEEDEMETLQSGRTPLAALAASLLLFVCASAAHAQTTVKIGLAVPNYGPFAPVYAADELGYYKENGVTAEITAYRGGPAAQEALAAGAADIINFFPPGVALAVKKGIKEKVVGIGSAKPLGWHIVVMASSPFHSVADIAGKKVGITAKGATTDFYALWAAKRAGVKIETVPVGAPALIPTLKSGQIDVAVLNSPLSFRLIVPGEGRSLVDLGKEMDPTLPDVWVATQSMLDGNPKAVEGTLRAIYKATAYMKKNRAYGIDYLRKFTGEKDDKVVELEYDVVLAGRPTAARIETAWIEASLALASLGGLTDLPALPELFTDRFSAVTGE
jgi:NitT/TauT family transport system substrate-binding protein